MAKGKAYRIIIRSMLVLACIVVLAALFLVFIASEPGERFLSRTVESRLGESIGLDIRIGLLETDLISRIVLQEISLSARSPADTTGAAGEDGEGFLGLSEIRIDFRLLDLLKRPLIIRNVDIKGLDLSLVRTPAGKTNLPNLPPGDQAGSGQENEAFGVEIHHARISDSSIRYDDRSPGRGTSLSADLEADLLMRSDGRYSYRIRMPGLAASDSIFDLAEADITLSGIIASEYLSIDTLSASMPGLAVEASGSLTGKVSEGSVTGRVLLEGDLGVLGGLARGDIAEKASQVEGLLRLEAAAKGPAADPSISWTLSLPEFKSQSLAMNGTFCRGTIAGGLLEADSLSTSILGGSVEGSLSMGLDSLLQTEARFEGRALRVSELLAMVADRETDYSGSSDFSMKFSGSLPDPGSWTISSTAGLSGLVYAGRPAGPFDLKIEMESGKFKVALAQEGTKAAIQGMAGDGSIDSGFSVDITDMRPLAALAGFYGLRGHLASHGTISGDIRKPSIEAEVRGGRISFRDVPLDTLSCLASLADGDLAITDLVFNGSGGFDPGADSFEMIPGLKGRFSYSGSLHDYPSDMNGQLLLHIDEASYGDFGLDEGSAEFLLAPGSIRLKDLVLRRDSLAVEARGDYNLKKSAGELDATFVRIRADGKRAPLRANDGLAPDSLAFMEFSTQGDQNAGTVLVHFEEISRRNFSINIDAAGIDLGVAASLTGLENRIGGKADIDIMGHGFPDSIEASGKVMLERPRFDQAGVDSLRSFLRYSGNSFHIDSLYVFQDMNRAFAQAHLDISPGEEGTAGISRSAPFSGRIITEKLDLASTGSILPMKADISGSFTADLSWDGTLGYPGVSGSLEIDGGSIRMKEDEAELSGIEMRARLEGSALHLDKLSGSLLDVPFEAKGEFRRKGATGIGTSAYLALAGHGGISAEGFISADSLDFDAEVDSLDLSLFEPFTPPLKNISGMLNAKLAAEGHLRNPLIEGRLTIRNLSALPSALDLPVTGGVADITFNRTDVIIDSMKFDVAEGSVSLSGKVSMGKTGPENFDLECAADNLLLKKKDFYSVDLRSAGLTFKTTGDYHLLDGDIILGESRLTARFRPQSILPFTRSLEKPPQEVSPFLSKTKLNVRIRDLDGLWLDNNLARLQLGTSISVIGLASKPNASGRVTVTSGYLLFIDRKLQVTNGIIDFMDPERLNPIVDITATTKVKSYSGITATTYLITLSVKGQLDEAVVTMTSVPPLERTDIISVLTVGQTRAQMTDSGGASGDGSAGGAILQRAKQLSSQRVTSYVSGKIGDALGLDQLSIEGDLLDSDKEGGATLVASKQISERAELTYTTGIGHINERRIRLEYRLTRRLSVQGETDQAGRSGIDFKYRLKYR